MIIGQYLPFCVFLLYCVCLFLTKYHPYIYFCGHNLLYPFLILLLTQRYAFFQVAFDCSCMWLRSWLAGKEKRLLKYVNNNKKACLLFVCERKHNWKCLGTNTYLFFVLPSCYIESWYYVNYYSTIKDVNQIYELHVILNQFYCLVH